MARVLPIALALALTAALLGRNDALALGWVQTYGVANPAGIEHHVLTPQGRDAYRFLGRNGTVTVAALANVGSNLRMAFWPQDSPRATDSRSCLTWTGETAETVQQGAVLRIVRTATYLRAVSVTKNIYLGAPWIFNVHVWDTRWGTPFHQIAGIDLSSELRPRGKVVPPPWHLCVEVVGQVLRFKVWVGREREPTYTDPKHAATVTVPPGWVESGQTGWFVGHIPRNGAAEYDHLATWRLQR